MTRSPPPSRRSGGAVIRPVRSARVTPTRSPMRRWGTSRTTRRSAPGTTRVLDVATVRIPPVLRPSVGGEKELTAAGSSVGEILQDVAQSHPDTQSQLFASDGELNRYVNVYLNDEDVRVLEGLQTPVGEGDTLVILPAMAGGSTS